MLNNTIIPQDAKAWADRVIHSPIKWTSNKGLTNCPLPSHNGPDRHASFSLDADKQVYFCHACQAGGPFRGLAKLLGEEWLVPDKPSSSKSKKEIEATYDYTDAAGKLIYQAVRYKNPKGFSQRRPNGNGGWVWNMQGVKPLPYKLVELSYYNNKGYSNNGQNVFIVEGEKDVQSLSRLGLIATCNHGGAGKWKEEHSQHFLEGTNVVILPDNDDAGQKHGIIVARSLSKRRCKIKVVELPGLPPKGDVSDWLEMGHTKEELLKLVTNTADWQDNGQIVDLGGDTPQVGGDTQGKNQVGLLLEMCAGIELLHNPSGETFGRFPVSNHIETLNLKSQNAKRWLVHKFFNETRLTPSPDAIKRVLENLDARAYVEGPKVDLALRVAKGTGSIWYDPANDQWSAIKITPGHWEVVEKPPALFVRAANTAQQVLPWKAEKYEFFRVFDFINLSTKDEQILFAVELISCLVPDIPHIVSIFHGEKGSAKSTAMRIRRKLIDPAIQELQIMPKDVKELPLLLTKNWMPSFDNLDGMSNEVSDILCSASTGGGTSKRTLYTNDDETMLSFKRCIALNGINEPASRSDLLDRSILFELERIEESQRKSESDFWAEFNEAKPRILGAMFRILADALVIYPTVKLVKLPRMADFAKYGYAIAEAINEGGGQRFLAALDVNKQQVTEEALSSSPVATAIVSLMNRTKSWTGTAGELLMAINQISYDIQIDTKARSWPRSAKALAKRLKLVKSNLLDAGITLIQSTDKHRKQILYNLVNAATMQTREVEGGDADPY